MIADFIPKGENLLSVKWCRLRWIIAQSHWTVWFNLFSTSTVACSSRPASPFCVSETSFWSVYDAGPGSHTVSCVGTLTWLGALQCGVVRGNTGAIREEIGAFNSLSSVHLAFLTGLSLYSELCVCVWVHRPWYVLASFSPVFCPEQTSAWKVFRDFHSRLFPHAKC